MERLGKSHRGDHTPLKVSTDPLNLMMKEIERKLDGWRRIQESVYKSNLCTTVYLTERSVIATKIKMLDEFLQLLEQVRVDRKERMYNV
jgi:hypothetical protein